MSSGHLFLNGGILIVDDGIKNGRLLSGYGEIVADIQTMAHGVIAPQSLSQQTYENSYFDSVGNLRISGTLAMTALSSAVAIDIVGATSYDQLHVDSLVVFHPIGFTIAIDKHGQSKPTESFQIITWEFSNASFSFEAKISCASISNSHPLDCVVEAPPNVSL